MHNAQEITMPQWSCVKKYKKDATIAYNSFGHGSCVRWALKKLILRMGKIRDKLV